MKALFLILSFSSLLAESPLMPIKLDSPRATMKSYYLSMQDYKKGIEENNSHLKSRINDAIRCFDLNHIAFISQKETGKNSALLLKEVLDRFIVLDYSKIPDNSELDYWRLKDSEITVRKIESGERKGQYLISKDTVNRLPEFYEKVEHLPYLKNSGGGAFYKNDNFIEHLPKWTKAKVFSLEKWKWAALFITFILGLFIKLIVDKMVSLLSLLFSKRKNSFKYHLIQSAEGPLGLVLSSFFAYTIFNYLQLDGILNTIFVTIIQLILSFSIVWFFYRSVRAFQVFAFRLAAKTESDLDDQLVPLVAKTLRVTIIVLGILITIQNFGINVMSLLAGLGLGGLAFALAAKDTAANFIGSIMILLDNPFKVGDWIVTNGAEGTVEEIGFRSTRIRTFYNSLVSLPNSSLVNANIDNMGKREFRRVKATLGVVYSTPPEQVLKFIEGIKEIIKKNPSTRKDYYHVRFTEYSASSLDILLYYFLQVNDWGDELEQKEAINIQILKLAKELDVSFAFPTQSIFLEKTQQD